MCKFDSLKVHVLQSTFTFPNIEYSPASLRFIHNCRDRQKGGVSHEEGLPSQVTALARAVITYASHIENPTVLLPVVRSICHKHVSRGVESIQYAAVGECLLAAMKLTLGNVATDAVLNAWQEAFLRLSEIFIDIEKTLLAELSEKAGFSGIVDMRVTSMHQHDDGARTIGVVPVHHAVPPAGKGQFVAVRIVLPSGSDTTTSMNLVEGPGDRLNFYVPLSKERASMAILGLTPEDIVQVSMPCGDVKKA